MGIQLTIAPLDKRAKTLDPNEIRIATGLLAESRGRGSIGLCPPDECPCGFASGDLPTSSTWRVREDLREPLVAAVALAAKRMKRFRFSATWVGNQPPLERAVTLEELEQLIEAGCIANSAFIVRAA